MRSAGSIGREFDESGFEFPSSYKDQRRGVRLIEQRVINPNLPPKERLALFVELCANLRFPQQLPKLHRYLDQLVTCNLTSNDVVPAFSVTLKVSFEIKLYLRLYIKSTDDIHLCYSAFCLLYCFSLVDESESSPLIQPSYSVLNAEMKERFLSALLNWSGVGAVLSVLESDENLTHEFKITLIARLWNHRLIAGYQKRVLDLSFKLSASPEQAMRLLGIGLDEDIDKLSPEQFHKIVHHLFGDQPKITRRYLDEFRKDKDIQCVMLGDNDTEVIMHNRTECGGLTYGQGTFGRVRGAHKYDLQKDASIPVAIKKIKPKTLREWFDIWYEVRASRALIEIENILPIQHIFVVPSKKTQQLQVCLVMDVAKEVNPVNLYDLEKYDYCVQVARTIFRMHEKGYIHNDLKSNNTGQNKNTGMFYLLDFGSALPVGAKGEPVDLSDDQMSILGGTYPAPECYEYRCMDVVSLKQKAKVDLRKIDVWAFGALLLNMYYPDIKSQYYYFKFWYREQKCSRNYHQDNNVDMLQDYVMYLKNSLKNKKKPLSEIAQIVLGCFEIDPDKRLSMQQVLERLESADLK